MFSFPRVNLYLGYWYVIWKVSITNRVLNLKNTPCPRGWRFYAKSASFLICLVLTFTLMLWLYSSFRFPYLYVRLLEKVHFKRCLLVCWEVSLAWGQAHSMARLAWGTWDKRKLCMVPYRSFNIDGIWEGKKGFKVIIWEDKPQRRDKFLWGKFSPLDTMLFVQKYRGSSINSIYSLETYGNH